MSQMTIRDLRAWAASVERHWGPHTPVWVEFPIGLETPAHDTTCAPLADGRIQTSADHHTAALLTTVAPVSAGVRGEGV
jgi:hypothetical protein